MLTDKTNFGLVLYNHANMYWFEAPMLVDQTNFGLVLYNHTNMYRFEETSSYWLVKTNISFSLLIIGQPATHLWHHSV